MEPDSEPARWRRLPRGRLARATAGTLFTAGAGQIFLLVSGPLLARLLGVEDRGHLAWLSAWVGIVVALGHLGAPSACGYYLSRDPRQTRQIVRCVKRLLVVQAVGLTIALWFILSFVADDAREVQLAVYPTLLLLPAALVHVYSVSILQAQQRFLAFNVARTAPVALFAGVIAVMFAAGQDRLVVVMLAWSLCYLAGGVGAGIAVLRRLPPEDEQHPRQLRRILSFAVRGLVSTTSPLDQFPLDQLLIGFVLSPVALGYWVVASAFRNLPMFVGQSIGMVEFPAVAATHDLRAGWRLVWRFLGIATVLLAPLAILLLALMPRLVELFFGADFAEAASIGQILVIGAFFAALRQVLFDGLRGLGRPGFATIAELSMYPWLLSATPFLIWKLDADGVAIGLATAFGISFLVALIGALRLSGRAGLRPFTRRARVPGHSQQRLFRPRGWHVPLARAGVIAGVVVVSLVAALLAARIAASLSTITFAAAIALIGVGAVWVSSRNRIFWLLAAAIAATPFTTLRALGALGNISDALFLLVLLALLVRASVEPRLTRQLFALGPRSVPLVLIAVGGLIASMNAESGSASLLILFKIVFTFWMIPNIFATTAETHERLRTLVWAFLAGATLASLGALADMVLGTSFEAAANPEFGDPTAGRYAGPTGHPNLLGLVAAIGVSGALGLYLTSVRRGAWALVAAGVCALGIVASASLTAMAGVVGGVAVALFMAGRRATLQRGAVLVGVFIATMFLVGKFASENGEILLLSRLEGDVLGQESVEERDAINDWAIAHIRENPVTGYGLDQVGTGPTHDDEFPIIHNLWIQTWYTAGLIGLVGFALLYFVTWRMRKDAPRNVMIPFVAMTVPWVASMISQPDVYARWGLIGVFGITAASIISATRPHEAGGRERAPIGRVALEP